MKKAITPPELCVWTMIFIGNPSRGDDGIGPLLYEDMRTWLNETATTEQSNQYKLPRCRIQLMDCFQLEPELCYDLEKTDSLIVIDASKIKSITPWVERISAAKSYNAQVWTHAMPLTSLLALFQVVFKMPHPNAYILHIPGKQFELGAPISQLMEDSKNTCLHLLKQCCECSNTNDVDSLLRSLPLPEDRQHA